jgi:hypothetical protein
MDRFNGRLFFMRGWRKIVKKTSMHVNDILFFKLVNDDFKMKLIRHNTSTESIFLCKHQG